MILVNIVKSLYNNVFEILQITSRKHICCMLCGKVVKNVSKKHFRHDRRKNWEIIA